MAADRRAEAAPAALPGWAREITSLAVLTGAGISTDSGIPDFRGPSGLWTKNPAAEKLSTYQAYMADPELRRRSWQNRLAHPAWAAEPNPAHLALARLARSTIDTQVITQNIDGLHQASGMPRQVIELHGTMSGVVCTSCGDRTAMADALARVWPCGGRPAVRPLRRDPEVGHDHVRRGTGARRVRPRCGRRRRLRPDESHRQHADRGTGRLAVRHRRRGGRGPGHHQPGSHALRHSSPPPSSATRSARPCPA